MAVLFSYEANNHPLYYMCVNSKERTKNKCKTYIVHLIENDTAMYCNGSNQPVEQLPDMVVLKLFICYLTTMKRS